MCRCVRQDGFTLIEMSLVLVIVGIVIMIVYPALTAAQRSTQQSLTTSNLYALMKASAAFVQSNGCLPCPTPASTRGAGFGHVRGDTVASLCGTCSVSAAEGIVPFVSLGIPAAMAKDGWGRWITMSVDPALTINFGVVPPTALCLSSDPLPCVLGESRKGLCQANLSTANRLNIATPGGGTQQAAILFLSHGANGYGAFYADPVANSGSNLHDFKGPLTACSPSGGYERCNANNDRDFVNAPLSNDPSSPFDDVMVFASRNVLVSLLGNPSCQTSW